jgi:hypothetical protein
MRPTLQPEPDCVKRILVRSGKTDGYFIENPMKSRHQRRKRDNRTADRHVLERSGDEIRPTLRQLE